jgi:GDP-4-dehydro-6-deoxy-D-mannose reductase
MIPNPVNPYAGSKLAAESYCRQYSLYSPNLSVVIARPFNHIGIGQRKEFVIPNFCHQIIQAKHKGYAYISIGDLTPTRDFSHVEDIVDGYVHLLEKGEAGEIYNICSGVERSIGSMLSSLIQISNSKIESKIDPERLRNSETSRVFGDNSKVKNLGWEPKHSIEETLSEIYRSIEIEYNQSAQAD